MSVAGLSQPLGYARCVVFTALGQVVTDTDATGLTTSYEWDSAHRLLSRTDPAGRETTTLYDAGANPLPTDTFGPAPVGYFGPDPRSTANRASQVPRTEIRYGEGIRRLAAHLLAQPRPLRRPPRPRDGGGRCLGGAQRQLGEGSPAGFVDQWSARFTGEIEFPASGTYEFAFIHDDGVRLFIDDRLVVDNWYCCNGPRGSFTGPAGRHRLRVDYYDYEFDAYLHLFWKRPNTPDDEVVPGAYLFSRYGLATRSITHDATPGLAPHTTTTAYADPASRQPTAVTEDPGGLGLTTSAEYDSYGRRVARTLPAGNRWTYVYYGSSGAPYYGVANSCASSTRVVQGGTLWKRIGPDPDGAGPGTARVEEFVYDAAGRVVACRIGGDAWTCSSYDARDRLTRRTIPALGAKPARTVGYDYKVGDNPLVSSVSDGAVPGSPNNATVTTTMDLSGQIASYRDVWGKTMTYTYERAGRLTDTSGPAGVTHTDHDAAGRPTSQSLDGATVAVPGYTNGELTSVSYPANGTSGTIGRDPMGRLTERRWQKGATALAADIVARSQSGRVVDQNIDGTDAAVGNNFGYDATGRLITASVPGHTLSYAFGAPSPSCVSSMGKNTNRTSMTDNGTTVTYCYDQADRLTLSTDLRFGAPSYDGHGNTIALGAETMTFRRRRPAPLHHRRHHPPPLRPGLDRPHRGPKGQHPRRGPLRLLRPGRHP